jgi:ribosomal protein S13
LTSIYCINEATSLTICEIDKVDYVSPIKDINKIKIEALHTQKKIVIGDDLDSEFL